jgi:hypothetical protein
MRDTKIATGVPDEQVVATAVNGAATITLPAPGPRNRWLLQAITISMSGDPTVDAIFTINTDTAGANTLIERIDFPRAACAPYNSRGAYKGAVGANVVCNLTALGAGVRGTVTVRAMKVPAQSI